MGLSGFFHFLGVLLGIVVFLILVLIITLEFRENASNHRKM